MISTTMGRAAAAAACALLATAAFAQAPARPKAIFHTSQGDFTVELYSDKSPKTVENFIGLAKGTKAYTDPRTNADGKGKGLYNGTVFHRVIKGFMIQGGDPLGQGIGGPGYKFEDEFSDLVFTKKGQLAMANSGPNTNGSQFFVTTSVPSYLNNKHTIFGEVVSGYDVVEKIENTPTARGDKPLTPMTITSIEIVEAGAIAGGSKSDKATTASGAAGETSGTAKPAGEVREK